MKIKYHIFCRRYRKQIKDFLNNLIQLESPDEDADESSLILEIRDNKNDIKNIFSSPKNNDTLNSISTKDDNKHDSLFVIDIQPNTNKKTNTDLDIPVYHNQVRIIFSYIYLSILLFFYHVGNICHNNVIINIIKIIDIF